MQISLKSVSSYLYLILLGGNYMSGGISAQYGFLYQKYVYILTALEHVSIDSYFVYEGKDDIDIEKENSLYSVSVSKKTYLQVKSGNIDKDCMIKVVGNWMNMDGFSSELQFILYAENDLSFSYNSKEFANEIIESFKKGSEKKRGAVLRTAYDKYSKELSTVSFEQKVLKLLNSIIVKTKSFEEISEQLLSAFERDYCSDIKIYELAKIKRTEHFINYICEAIDKSIAQKASYVLKYSGFINFVQKVREDISDRRYNINVHTTKTIKKEEAKKIIKNCIAREVQQLYLVNEQEEFIIEGIIQELLYKDFRNVYLDISSMDISNIEQEAKDNYDETLFELEFSEKTPRNIYTTTVKKQIENDLLPKGQLYKKGCYIYLTSDDAPEEFQIAWEDNDAK